MPTTITAGTLPAQPTTEAAQGQQPGPREKHHRHGAVAMLLKASEELDLSPDQRAKVEKIRADYQSKMQPARSAWMSLANTLADGVAAGAVDRAKADADVAHLTKAAAGVHDEIADSLNKLHAVLTPQQRAALIDKVQARREQWRHAHGEDAETESEEPHAGRLAGLQKELGLTQDQVDKIRASLRKEPGGSEERIHAYANAFKSDTFNARTLLADHADDKEAAKKIASKVHFYEAVAPVLTPEQRKTLAQEIRDRATPAKGE